MSWYAITCKVRQEQNTDMALTVRGYKTYLPLTLKDRRKQPENRSKNVTEPLFPRYLFIYMSEGEDDFYPITKVPGVVSLVKMTYVDNCLCPTPVSDKVIESLKALEDEQGIHATTHDYEEGDRIRVKSGVFKDIETIVKARSGDDRVIALMHVMGKTHEIELDYRTVEPA